MAHEIYYTSAPEGIKRGTSGFCTVAATENIPRALWERLEALSAYRHHFSANESGGADRNPASWAHWMLNVAGASYHVLSHVCDSGVDHTHRTNAFAHHIALDPSEMAAAGPAWMLQQYGTMAGTWDGQVGGINRGTPLPRGDENPAVCSGWASLTGDAGWGGVLAEGAIKSPARPVCILFSPGQEVLPLIREALRLLPAKNRWAVTFNTYFTSMPTSATCLWRCCLKGTPASDIALRYAQAGLVLDLTDPSRLGRATDSEYVTMARTGQLSPAARLARATTPQPPVKVTKPVMPVRAKSPPVIPIKPPPVFTPEREPEPPIEEYLFRDEPPIEDEAPVIEMTTPVLELPPPEDEIPELRAVLVPEKARNNDFGNRRLVPSLGDAAEALHAAEQAKHREANKHRKNLTMMYMGALGAIAIGMILVWMAYKASIPPELPAGSRPGGLTPIGTPPDQEVVTPVPPAQTQDVPPIVIDNGNHTNNTQAVAPPPPPPPPPPPKIEIPKVDPVKTIICESPLERLNMGSGIGDKTQTIILPTNDLPKLKMITGLKISFPGNQNEYAYKQGSLSGTLTARSETVAGRPGPALTLHWKDNGNASSSADVVTLLIHRQRAAMDVIWKTSTAQRKPEMTLLAYWVLQNSGIVAELPGGKTERIEFKPTESSALSLKDASASLSLPAAAPHEAVATLKTELPKGWTATWYTDWEVKDAALRTPENASQVIKFKRTTATAAVDGWFMLTFRPGMTTVESTFAKRQAADESDLARYESDLRAVNDEIAQIKRDFDKTDPTLDGKKVDLEALVAAYKVAVAGYKELSDLDIALELPDGVRIATLRFRR